ncbi:MAG: aldehyde dehydrogenase family protein, partial [Planctomycetota bacterium]
MTSTARPPKAVDASELDTRAANRTAPTALDFGTAWDYAPAPESVKVTIADRSKLYINGTWTDAEGSKTFTTTNPATEVKLAEVADAGAADVDRAVAAARDALPAWSALPGAERGKYLFRIARRIQERAREFETEPCRRLIGQREPRQRELLGGGIGLGVPGVELDPAERWEGIASGACTPPPL